MGSFTSSKPEITPVPETSQSPGTSNCVPHLGLVTTFQPGTVGAASSPPRGFAAGADEDSDAFADGDEDALPSATSEPPLSSSLFMTTTPVTTAATTTTAAATTATIVVFFLSSGCGPPGPPGTAYCGTVGCWYGLGCG